MAKTTDDNPAPGLPERVDQALAAFWRGQPDELEQLVNPRGTAGPRVGELLGELRAGAALPVTGLTDDCAPAGYQLIREIGRGGMGVVYEAEQEEPKRRLALKVFGGLVADEYRLRCFRQEIELQAPLRHPAIATVYAAGRTPDGRPFFTMELVNGEPLNRYVRRLQLSLPARLELFLQICDAVEYAHKHKVIHRDLKPGNILVDSDGHPRILDFGLAKMTDADVTATITLLGASHVAGTLAYMSPEQARGQVREIGRPSDVYSLGVILYELLTDQLPYELGEVLPHEALRVIQEQAPRRPSALIPIVRGDLETIVLKALEKDVTLRYQTAGDLREDIRRFLAAEPILARRPSGLYILHKRLIRHRSAVRVAAIVLAIGAVGAAGGLGWRAQWLAEREAHMLREDRLQALRAMQSLDIGELDQGYGDAHAVNQRHPDLPEAQLVLAQAMFKRREGEGRHTAIRQLEAGLERDPTRWEYAALLAEMHRIGSDVARAEELDVFTQRIAFETGAAWYLRSFATFDQEKAHRFAQEAVARPDADALAWERYANLCILTDQWEEALRGADVLIEASGDADRWMLVRARLLARAGQVSRALAQYNAVIRLNDDGYLYRGHLYRQLGDYAQAVADYTSVIESVRQPTANGGGWRAGSRAKPKLWAHYHRATALWMQGDLAAVIADYRHIRPTLGRPFYSDARLYVVLREVGSDAEAQDVISRALDEVSDDNPWLRDIFRCLAGLITPDALIDEPAARTHTGRRCEAYYYAGEVYRLDGDWDRARACFERCMATGAAYDPARPLEPMNEYELARWRLKQLSAEPSAPTSARVDD